MPNYHRLRRPGGMYFFTVVTYNRLPILTSSLARQLLHRAMADVKGRFPFTTIAICLLPDHLHCIWELPEGDENYSIRWGEIKRKFSLALPRNLKLDVPTSDSRLKRREVAIWQRRFWEHTIRDELDLWHHVDYIHYNPVKHGLVETVADWEWSSFHMFVKRGVYEPGWGQGAGAVLNGMEAGE